MNTARHLGDDLECKPGGIIETRANDVLHGAQALLSRVAQRGLFDAIEQGFFADVSRPPDGGRGFEGVFAKDAHYWNPFEEFYRPHPAASDPGRSTVVSKTVKPYGDTLDDGAVQLSFTLPIPWSEAADEAARRLVAKMGFQTWRSPTDVRSRASIRSSSFTAERHRRWTSKHQAPSAKTHPLTMEEIDALIARSLGRKVRVAGA